MSVMVMVAVSLVPPVPDVGVVEAQREALVVIVNVVIFDGHGERLHGVAGREDQVLGDAAVVRLASAPPLPVDHDGQRQRVSTKESPSVTVTSKPSPSVLA